MQSDEICHCPNEVSMDLMFSIDITGGPFIFKYAHDIDFYCSKYPDDRFSNHMAHIARV